MIQTGSRHADITSDCEAEIIADPDEFGALMGPILAGARARGVADAFELMGVAAVLLDGAGSVLHVGGRAERALAPLVRVAGGQLIGFDAATNDLLQRVIAAAIEVDARGQAEAVVLRDLTGRDRLAIRAVRFPQAGVAGPQLLRGILVVAECAQ